MGNLAELEYDHNWHTQDRAGDEKLFVRFSMDVLPDVDASVLAGIRKFRDVEMVTIITPGDKRNIIVREARPDDIERFNDTYKKFKAGIEEQNGGTPIEEWPQVTRAMATEFKYLGFHSVEQLATASDGVIARYPGMREVQRRAQHWLEAQAGAAPLERLETELRTRDDQIAAMQAQMAEMTAALAKLTPAAKAG